MANIGLHHGDLLQVTADLVVLPCNTRLGVSGSSFLEIVRSMALPTELTHGEVTKPTEVGGTAYVLAASVHNEQSSPRAIEQVGSSLGRLAADFPIVAVPLLGAGRGRLNESESAVSLARGFNQTAPPTAKLVVAVFGSADRFKRVERALRPMLASAETVESDLVAAGETESSTQPAELSSQDSLGASPSPTDSPLGSHDTSGSTQEGPGLQETSQDSSKVSNDLELRPLEGTWLGANEQASALVEVMASAQSEEEICIAVLGHWGRGKTYLANRVAALLPARHQPIWFSAWRYNKRSETWAFLFETFRNAMLDQGWLSFIARSLRGSLERKGLLPICLALLLVATSAIPIGSLALAYGPVLLGFLGLYGAVRLALVGLKGRAQSEVVREYLSSPDHSSHLGLQGAMGADLRALICGWTGPLTSQEADRLWRRCLAYSICVLVVLLSLWIGIGGLTSPHESSAIATTVSSWIGPLTEYPGTGARMVIVAIVATGLLCPPIVAWWVGLNTDRFLLIIDDLDRVPQERLLEVVESVKLLLEDDELRKRVSVLMLVEEDALRKALAKKYCGASTDALPDASVARAVEENLQKLFLAHLRLGPLGQDEQLEVLENVANLSQEHVPLATSLTPSSQLETAATETLATEGALPGSIADPEPQPSGPREEPSPQLTSVEFSALRSALDTVARQDSHWARPGPRAIKTLVFRYKLARSLALRRLPGNRIDVSKLATWLALELSGEGLDELGSEASRADRAIRAAAVLEVS